jgi:hypothetical protein
VSKLNSVLLAQKQELEAELDKDIQSKKGKHLSHPEILISECELFFPQET